MKYNFVGAGPTTTASWAVSNPGNKTEVQAWHLFVNGTFGAGGSLAVQYSPDSSVVTDATSRWFVPTILTMTAGGDTWFQARFRKVRFVFTGGDGTTNLTAEIV